jgi:murein L,D-transpeptidase YafK
MHKITLLLFSYIFIISFSGCGLTKFFTTTTSTTPETNATSIDKNQTRKQQPRLPRICFEPNTTPLQKILENKQLKPGIPLYIRIFKKEKIFELWGKNHTTYELLKKYPICSYSGYLGPKLRSGDKQAPEGVYVLTKKSLHPNSRYHLALNIQYPNRYDRNHHRSGNLIMIHGKCSSTGCFAMGDTQIEEIYKMVESAFKKGEKFVYVAIYPFRMNEKNLEQFHNSYWYPFWKNIKTGYDYFEQTHIPPFVGVRGAEYVFQKRGHDLNITKARSIKEQNLTNLTQN